MTRIITLLFSIFALATLKAQHHQYNLFVGTYTNSCQSKGVYVYNFDTNSGEASFKTASELIIPKRSQWLESCHQVSDTQLL